jgi:tetratricopeptide (TPR) repeat protein
MPDEAEARARRRLRENPPDPDPLWIILADALAEQGRLEEALAALGHVRPDTERCLVEANLQEKLGYRARAAAALRRHVEHAPEDVSTRVRLALLLWDLGDWEAAEAQFLEAARLRGTYPAPRRELGLRYAAWGRYAQARENFERFESLGGTPGANDLAHIALALHRTGEHERSREIVVRLLEGAPTGAPGEVARLHLLAGSIAVALGRPAEAEASFRAALGADPRDPDAHYNLGMLLASQGRLVDALHHFDLSKQYGYPVFAIPPLGDRGRGRR